MRLKNHFYSVTFFLFILFNHSYVLAKYQFPLAPNLEVTPGDFCHTNDPDFSDQRYQEKISWCKRNVSRHLKNVLYEKYGVPVKCRDQYTIDHFVPLALGGNNNVKNLWPEHKSIKATRADLEYKLFLALEKGEITQKEAVKIIVNEKLNPKVEETFDLSVCGPRVFDPPSEDI